MVFKLSCNQITLSLKISFGLLCNIAIPIRYPQRTNINFHIHIYTCRQKNVYNLCYCILSTYTHQMLFQSPLSQQDQESELSQTQYLFAEINSNKILVLTTQKDVTIKITTIRSTWISYQIKSILRKSLFQI